MPAISIGSKVLVTGANGYIATWIVRTLLEQGYNVRGTVRTSEKGNQMKEQFKSYGEAFEFFVVPDIIKEGAFDEAVKGVHAIEHVASPLLMLADDCDPNEYIKPAVNGTLSLLNSALKNGLDVKRITYTSSGTTVLSPGMPPKTYNEEDWNQTALKVIEEKGGKAPTMFKYMASKILAEKAAWDFYNDHKDYIKWDLVSLIPVFTLGPPIHLVSNPQSLNFSMKMFYNNVIGNALTTKEGLSNSTAWVDVRDAALAHVKALSVEEAGGERIIACADPFIWQDWIEVAKSITPPPYTSREFSKGMDGIERVYFSCFDTSKISRIMGIKFRTKKETARDILEDFAKRGW